MEINWEDGMKVKIGQYKNWFGPYQLAEALCFWAKKTEDEYGCKSNPDWVHSFGEWLAHGFAPDESHLPKYQRKYEERPTTWLYDLMTWIHNKQKRTVDIKIDKWDTWNMDRTLALIILPMLKQLRATKHGSPFTDDEDVPDHLKASNQPPKENKYDVDASHDARWDWIVGEMIWAFEQHQPDADWEQQYYSGEHDVYTEPCEWDADGKPKMYEMKRGPSDNFEIDSEGMAAHQKRIDNGFRLFGKYYQGLWD